MDTERAVRRGHPILYGMLALFSLIDGIMSSVIAAFYNEHHNYPSITIRDRVRFVVFASWWTFLFAILYSVFFLGGIGGAFTSIASHGIWIFITLVIWAAAAGAITNGLKGGLGSCSYNAPAYCKTLNAIIAFSWINFAIVALLTIFIILIGGGAFRKGNGLKRGLV